MIVIKNFNLATFFGVQNTRIKGQKIAVDLLTGHIIFAVKKFPTIFRSIPSKSIPQYFYFCRFQ